METSKTTCHSRSSSLPSSLISLDVSIVDQLCRLRDSQAGPSFSSFISQNLCSVKNLYEQMTSLVHLPHNQQVLSNASLRGKVEEVLEGSLALLDISSSALDALSQMKESILDLESALRRGSSTEGIKAYVMSRKKISKTLSKCLVNLKKAQKCSAMTESGSNTLNMLNEAESITFSILRSMISYLMGKKEAHGWSLVAKLVKSKHVNREAVEDCSEIEDLDRVLCSVSNKKSSSNIKVLLKQLKTLELAISELHDGMDPICRCIIKTRVSLLNVLY